MAKRIDDYALIGDGRSAALVARDAAIEFLCLPRFDSSACMAAMLGKKENGLWRLAPKVETNELTRCYRGDTLILETTFACASGRVMVIDFMPVGRPNPCIVRIVRGLAGSVPMRMDLVVRFDFGRRVPWVTRSGDGALAFVAGPHLLLLRTPVEHRGEDLATTAEFDVAAGDTVVFTLSYGRSVDPHPDGFDVFAEEFETERYWRVWAERCNYVGPWRKQVVRSLVTLKALTYRPTGGVVAAATTSLPELPGGKRNWDYRYCWLRDSTFTLLAFLKAGYAEEADAWRNWVVRAIAGSAAQVQPLYNVLGESRIEEWEPHWLEGFGGARPVRVGNLAYRQQQLDMFGEVLDVLHHARCDDPSEANASWALQRELLKHLETVLEQPDHGIWEIRGRPRQFTYSKVMVWVAFDRAIRGVEQFGLNGPAEHWRHLRHRLHAEICAEGFNRDLGAFVMAYGEPELDAATLLIPLVGFLPATDPRVVGTVRAIQERLSVGHLIRRYDTEAVHDGLPNGEGLLLACSFWLADNLILQGRIDAGRDMFERALGAANDVGLLSEQYDVTTGTQFGNFPQALSHLSLIGTAYNLAGTDGPAHRRSRRDPVSSPI
jgi:GH15 family glucan-1,4-alpha-glucosidase